MNKEKFHEFINSLPVWVRASIDHHLIVYQTIKLVKVGVISEDNFFEELAKSLLESSTAMEKRLIEYSHKYGVSHETLPTT